MTVLSIRQMRVIERKFLKLQIKVTESTQMYQIHCMSPKKTSLHRLASIWLSTNIQTCQATMNLLIAKYSHLRVSFRSLKLSQNIFKVRLCRKTVNSQFICIRWLKKFMEDLKSINWLLTTQTTFHSSFKSNLKALRCFQTDKCIAYAHISSKNQDTKSPLVTVDCISTQIQGNYNVNGNKHLKKSS